MGSHARTILDMVTLKLERAATFYTLEVITHEDLIPALLPELVMQVLNCRRILVPLSLSQRYVPILLEERPLARCQLSDPASSQALTSTLVHALIPRIAVHVVSHSAIMHSRIMAGSSLPTIS